MNARLEQPGTPIRLAWTTRVALALGIAVLLGILIRAYFQPQRNSVYPIFSNAAREWSAGIDVYDRSLPRPNLDKYRYAPIVAAAFTPLAGLSDSVGGVIWRIINAAVFVVGVAVFGRVVYPGREASQQGMWTLLAWALVPLSLGSLNNAQPNALVIGCGLLAAAAVVSERWWLAGLCLGVPVIFKVYPVALALLLGLMRPWKIGWRVAAVIALGVALPFLAQDPDYVSQCYRSWFDQVAGDNRRDYPLEYSYRDLHTLLRGLGWTIDDHSFAILQLMTAAGAAAIVATMHWRGQPSRRVARAAIDLGCCWIIVFGPATENCTYILVAPTFGFAAVQAFRPNAPRWQTAVVVTLAVLFAGTAIASSTPFGRGVSWFLMPAGGVLLMIHCLASLAWPGSPTKPRAVSAAPLARAA